MGNKSTWEGERCEEDAARLDGGEDGLSNADARGSRGDSWAHCPGRY